MTDDDIIAALDRLHRTTWLGSRHARLIRAGAAFALAFLICAFLAMAARAQSNVCGERDAILQRLQEKYGETRKTMGLQQNNGVVETFANDETGTWTILVTLPTGMTCLVAAGEAWDGGAALAAVPGKQT